MYVTVNGARLYVDVEGAGLVPDGDVMRERPTLILLHGGPGVDHSLHKPAFSHLSDVAQIIYYDHRGNGRSEQCDTSIWNLDQWGDDVRGLCDALGIEKPIVCGTSFGGFVAQSYATRHPDHVGKLVLVSTAAKFDFPTIYRAFGDLGGPKAYQAAEGYWGNPSSESRAHYRDVCVPLYQSKRQGQPDWAPRMIVKDDVAIWFNGPANEHGRMDFRGSLAKVTCPTLVISGGKDPITPQVFSEDIVDHLTSAEVQYERFPEAGHGVVGDEPERFFDVLREFLGAG